MKNFGFLKGIGYYFFAELLCLFLTVTLTVVGGTLFKILSAVCTVAIVCCLVGNYAVRCAEQDRKQMARGEGQVPKLQAVWLGISASLMYWIFLILLYLAWFGILPDTFYRIYKVINAPFWQLYNFINADIVASALSVPQMIGFTALTFLPFAITVFVYQISSNGRKRDTE